PSLSQTLDGLGPVQFLPQQLGVGSPKGLPSEYNGKQLIALDPDRVFNAILSKCAHGTNRPDRMTVCPNLAPNRLESLGTVETRLQRCRENHSTLGA
ncbi:hypothetical protein PanWU01x14_113050, partial [Parasponia andersonii]